MASWLFGWLLRLVGIGLVIALIVWVGHNSVQSTNLAGEAGTTVKNVGGAVVSGVMAFFGSLLS